MDALELTYPVHVVAPKLMGPDGSVRTEVTIEEVELCQADRGSSPSSYSFQHFSSYGSLKGGIPSHFSLILLFNFRFVAGFVFLPACDNFFIFSRSNLATA